MNYYVTSDHVLLHALLKEARLEFGNRLEMSDKQTEIEHEQINIEDEQSLSGARERNRTLD